MLDAVNAVVADFTLLDARGRRAVGRVAAVVARHDEHGVVPQPELARGAIPCFGLTSANAGSDAAGSMTDTGTSFVDEAGAVRIRLDCDKRYITLAPMADLVGLAFKLRDADGLLET